MPVVTNSLSDPQRLAALRRATLLDRQSDEGFDRIARLARTVLRVPVALVSIVDVDRQIFKGRAGLPEPWATSRETPINQSFCRYAVESGEPLIIDDARVHPLVHDNPSIELLGVIAYAGIPLITKDGQVLGSFCVIDHQPRHWTADDVATLTEMAALVMTGIELRTEITERRTTEAALRESEQRYQEASAAKTKFLNMVSHELRTPLGAIGGYTDLLEMGARGPVSPEQIEYLKRIKDNQQHLLRMINDLLGYAKIESGQTTYDMRDISVDEIVTAVETMIQPQLEAKQLTYHRELDDPRTTVYADSDKTRQIVLNLMSNAVKFTPPNGTVAIATTKDDGAVRITVRDTGVGIAPDKLDYVFEPFVQVPNRMTRGIEGTGLGLAISREFARGMGGEVTVESSVGAGSAFTVVLQSVSGGRSASGVDGPSAIASRETASL